MKQLCIIIFLGILFCVDAVYAGDVVKKHYDRNCDVIGHVVTDDDGNETYFDRDWNRTGHSVYKNNRTVIYNKDQNRVGCIKWDGDTGTEFDQNGNRTGYRKKVNGKTIIYDENWQRKGYER